MTDLTTWLLEQIADEENEARGPDTWRSEETGGRVIAWSFLERADVIVAQAATHIDATHIARWDPARVLAECEAKRAVIALHAVEVVHQWVHEIDGPDREEPDASCAVCGWFSFGTGCETVRLLALPYADRPGYREEWRP